MLAAVDHVFVKRGMESLLQSAHGAGNLQRLLAGVHLQYLEALGLEPALDRLHILITGSELLSELAGSEPFMKIRRAWRVQIMQQLLQGGFLLGTALQNQMQPF